MTLRVQAAALLRPDESIGVAACDTLIDEAVAMYRVLATREDVGVLYRSGDSRSRVAVQSCAWRADGARQRSIACHPCRTIRQVSA